MIVLKMEGGGGGGGGVGEEERFGWAMIMTRKVIIWRPMESLNCVCVVKQKETLFRLYPSILMLSFTHFLPALSHSSSFFSFQNLLFYFKKMQGDRLMLFKTTN